jgi:hypothetical protein
MRGVTSFIFSAFAFVSLALAQSSSSPQRAVATTPNRDSVQGLYGSPVDDVYQTRTKLTVTASFAPSGNLCRAVIRSSGGMTDAELNPVLDELAPKEARGKFKMGTFLNVTCLRAVKAKDSKSNSDGRATTELETARTWSALVSRRNTSESSSRSTEIRTNTAQQTFGTTGPSARNWRRHSTSGRGGQIAIEKSPSSTLSQATRDRRIVSLLSSAIVELGRYST